MSQNDGSETAGRGGAAVSAPQSATLRESLRSIAHDLNDALNGVALSVELLDRTTVAAPATDAAHATAATATADSESGPEAGRQRYLTNLRHSVRRIQEIIEHRLQPLGRDTDTRS